MMFESFIKLVKEKRVFVVIFLLVLSIGIFLRSFQFEDNLLFGIDQARDWKNAKLAYDNGIGELELLGPRAGGTFFRLGPITTYFYYVAMLVFGDGLAVPSYPDLLFSILAIPLFYLFAREYFSKKTSLVIMALFSVSLFAVEYSRFGWNPNSVPFFTLLFSYGLLRFGREAEVKKKWFFLVMASFGFGVLIQLHTISMVAAPMIFLVYMLLGGLKIRWKEIVASVLVVATLLSPVLVSEFSSGFSNTEAFWDAFNDRNKKKFGFDKKILAGVYGLSRGYFIILTSRNDIGALEKIKSNTNVIGIVGDNLKNWEDMVAMLLIFVAIVFSLVAIFRDYRSLEINSPKKNFLLLFLVSNAVYITLLIFLSEKQDSRHYLGLIFTPFLIFGYHFEKIWSKYAKARTALATLIILLVALNLFQCVQWLRMLESYSDNEKKPLAKEYVLEPYFNVTLSQYKEIADYIENQHKESSRDAMIYASVYFKRPILHILQYERGFAIEEICKTCHSPQFDYYLIDETSDLEKRKAGLPSKIYQGFRIVSQEKFGTLTISVLKAEDENEN